MEKKDMQGLEWVVLIGAVIAGLVFFLGMKRQEINLCQQTLAGLVKGRYSVQKFIDWENLKALDVDVGAAYTHLPNEKEKTNYRKAFIQNFSAGFKQAGGKLKAFTHWRIDAKDDEKTVVAVDDLSHNKTLLFTISKSGKRKLTALEWR